MDFNLHYFLLSSVSLIAVVVSFYALARVKNTAFKVLTLSLMLLNSFEFIMYQSLAYSFEVSAMNISKAYLFVCPFVITALLDYLVIKSLRIKYLRFVSVCAYVSATWLLYLGLSGLLINEVVIGDVGVLHEDGPMSIFFDMHVVFVASLCLVTMVVGAASNNKKISSQNLMSLYAFLPVLLYVIVAILFPYLNISIVLPLLSIYLLLSLDYVSGTQFLKLTGDLTVFFTLCKDSFVRVLSRVLSFQRSVAGLERDYVMGELELDQDRHYALRQETARKSKSAHSETFRSDLLNTEAGSINTKMTMNQLKDNAE